MSLRSLFTHSNIRTSRSSLEHANFRTSHKPTCQRANRPTGEQANRPRDQETRTKGQESRNKAREAWGKLQTLKPRQGTLTFLQHREVASPRDFGEMFPVICESFWLSFGILRRLSATVFFHICYCPGYICLLTLPYLPYLLTLLMGQGPRI